MLPNAISKRFILCKENLKRLEVIFIATKKGKIIFSALLVILVSSSLYANVYARETTSTATEDPALKWANVGLIISNLSINNNGRATMSGTVMGNTGTESITVDAVLERVNTNGTFTQVGSWNNLHTNGSIWTWERAHNVARGHDYRLTLTATVVRNGVSETVSSSRTSTAN